ncbi:phosphomevalonate kinase [Enterococcus sp. AZ109]|uniref:phosphomevalonate kinase n=1 Tax=Enterococcus sp. AZ109 TaxID=2774634 RepID=UPI003F274D55
MIEVSAPGKLYIAGEYAVVEAGHPAIIVAIDQFINVSIETAKKSGSIQSAQYSDMPVRWTRQNNELVLNIRDNPFHYILAAIHFTERYAQEKGEKLAFFDLKVTSELDNSNGRKYGLGSSGAVTVATVKALNAFYNLQLTQLELFKLATLAHLNVQGNGSCGDIAASCYGGWIAFSTFDHDWLLEKLEQENLATIIESDWPSLRIESLKAPDDLRLLIGWTGSPASTSDLVDQVHQSREEKAAAYEKFLADSKACVDQMIDGFKQENIAEIQAMIRRNRALLNQLTTFSNVSIETQQLKILNDLAEKYEGAAKSSGAGGGDCGIVIVDKRAGILPLMSSWEKAGITPLPLHVYHYTEEIN